MTIVEIVSPLAGSIVAVMVEAGQQIEDGALVAV